MFARALAWPLVIGMGCVGAALAPRAARADDPPGAYKAPSPEPSPVETLLLEYINRTRAQPALDGARMLQTMNLPKDVDYALFQTEMQALAPAPPLVFDLALLKAARWHSYYQALNDQRHDELPDRPGFTGASPFDRVRLAGADTRAVAENVFRTARDPWYCHCAFVIDWGAGPGGMQPGRGHRVNITRPEMRAVGVGAVLHAMAEDFAVTHNFGASDQRFVGGVVYHDKNRNRFYDIGEGVGEMPIKVGDLEAKVWKSGAYAVAIPAEKAKLAITLEGKAYAIYLPDGADNVKFDVLVEERAARQRGGQLLEAVKRVPDEPAQRAQRFAALVNLHLAARAALVEEAALDEILSLTAPVQAEFEADLNAARQAVLEAPPADAEKTLRPLAAKYTRTEARAWFTEAAACLEMRETIERLEEVRQGGRPLAASALERALKTMSKRQETLDVLEWKATAQKLTQRLLELGR